MRTRSHTKPKQVKIFKRANGKCEVNIATNIVEARNGSSLYIYDLYRFIWNDYYDGLEQEIENDFDTWASYAKMIDGVPEEPSDSEKIAILTREVQNLKEENKKLWEFNKQIINIIRCLSIYEK